MVYLPKRFWRACFWQRELNTRPHGHARADLAFQQLLDLCNGQPLQRQSCQRFGRALRPLSLFVLYPQFHSNYGDHSRLSFAAEPSDVQVHFQGPEPKSARGKPHVHFLVSHLRKELSGACPTLRLGQNKAAGRLCHDRQRSKTSGSQFYCSEAVATSIVTPAPIVELRAIFFM